MKQLFIGLMSGTSLDAIDAVLVEFNHSSCRLLASHSHPLPDKLRQALVELTLPGENEIERLAEAEPAFARESANAVQSLLKVSQHKPDSIIAIGSHGQTIRHRPEKNFTLQIGDPSLIAELTHTTVVADFRRRDMAAGGQGAPLVPAFHQSVFRQTDQHSVIINVGGMANLTILDNQPVRGFDTGPGNILMDQWCLYHLDQPYDEKGQWADSARFDQKLLDHFLKEPYFQLTPPKSTGRERFNMDWLNNRLEPFRHLSPAVVQSTLCQLTASTIAHDIQRYAPDCQALYLCGGGAHNLTLIKRIQQLLPDHSLSTTEALGIHPDWVEAAAFAWLARQALENQPGNLPEVTGASHCRILGGIYPA
ncbi:anhydro-N-acetylmuramic acid kinase [Endozoicomonas montiporae]|uniref:Anhydro-N-acetylmuramic acid kinase n=2 Tax=Endozoicomonas montiporae TaxID=1027273 RepID=A0A081N8P6_9GAMM|nr:anhydro-N-acetylmuramic acid kinase [Endozoicomonas montiporae]AMO55277.1 anhydro-N-acetylmuramic acid kinase [Endozoicomonas montiporae CL-33]KEQ14819.1 anhydro-N-acetylmuramic acid kinase [Endozoicomonas montiporae]